MMCESSSNFHPPFAVRRRKRQKSEKLEGDASKLILIALLTTAAHSLLAYHRDSIEKRFSLTMLFPLSALPSQSVIGAPFFWQIYFSLRFSHTRLD